MIKPVPDISSALNQAALVAQIDQHGNILYINEKFLRLMGFSADEIIGQSYKFLIQSSHLPRLIPGIELTLRTGITWQGEFCHISKSGQIFWTEATMVPGADPEQGTPLYHIIAFEVTERKMVEEAFTRAKTFVEKILDLAPVGFFMAKTSGDCNFINRQWTDTSGLRLRHALGSGWLNALHPADREDVKLSWQAFVEEGKPFDREYRYQHADGRETMVHAVAARIEGVSDAALVRVERDMTVLRENEKLIERQRMEAFHTSRIKALMDMAGGVAHEINNPLAIIKAKAQQTLRLAKANSIDRAKLQQFLSVIDSTSDRVAGIVKSLISITSGECHAPFEWTTVEQILQTTLSVCAALFRAKSIRLEQRIGDPALSLKCRPSQISQLLLQVLTNAMEAVESCEERWVKLTVQKMDASLQFTITDSGPGMDEDTQDKIFLPFFTTRGPGKGTGLGLCLAQSIAESHQGQLVLNKTSPHTEFVITLPIDPQIRGAA